MEAEESMPALTLVLEDYPDQRFATSGHVERAVSTMARPGGPTYVVLRDAFGGYAQAAGFDDRYRIETREAYGEGFRHWLAGSPTVKDRSDVVMYYRNQCKVHGRRRCPLPAWGENVLALSDVLSILLFYHSSGERLGSYRWEDVTEYFLDAGLQGKSRFIRDIRPHDREE